MFVLNVGVPLHVTVSVPASPSVTLLLHMRAWAKVRGDACTKAIVEAAVSAEVSVDVMYA